MQKRATTGAVILLVKMLLVLRVTVSGCVGEMGVEGENSDSRIDNRK